MAENNQELQGLEGSTQQEATGDKHSMLLKLAERTVVQAEALAQEINEHARQESKAVGAKIIADASEKAKVEARQTVDAAKRRSEGLTSEAAAEALADSERTLSSARSESEKILSKAKSDSEKLLTKAKDESEKILSKAKADGESSVGTANSEVQEIIGKARQEAQAIIKASQTRADSTESKARLQAEFFIRQTTQNVTDGIRASVLEICNNLLPAVEEFGKGAATKALNSEKVNSSVATDAPMLESADSGDDRSPATNGVESDRPKARASKRSIAA